MTDSTFQKYKAVVDEWFVNGFNGVKAYQKFYPKSKYKSAESNFRKILAITRISEYVDQRRNQIAEESKITVDECVSILTDMARFDIAECYNEHGALKPIHEIPQPARMAIESLDSEEYKQDGMVVSITKKIKTSNRRANIVELMKYLGGFEKDNDQKTPKAEREDLSKLSLEELKTLQALKMKAKG